MKILNSKKGFTLIELLVVIGILAVLAAIAIPSVAGLIDRANVSADKTNANEMTNAVERFAAEYELYCQDIASGLIDEHTTDFDAAQGRVLNVTGIRTRGDVTAFESETGLGGKGINRDTKYPVNEATLKSIVENYTKTSSATFTPKQSDKAFYYSPEVGVVVVDDFGATVDHINGVAFDGEDDIAQFDAVTWICLDSAPDNVATNTEGTFGELETNIHIAVVKTMYINDVEYQYEEGMTWGQWVASKYNPGNIWIDDDKSVRDSNHYGSLYTHVSINLSTDGTATSLGSGFFTYSYNIVWGLAQRSEGTGWDEEEWDGPVPLVATNGYYYFQDTSITEHYELCRIPVEN